jgi:hypothetical protein
MATEKEKGATDFGAKMTELLQGMERLNHRLSNAERENVCLKKELEDTRANLPTTPRGDGDRDNRDEPVRARAFVSRLTTYNPDKDDIRLFMRRFNAYCETNRLDEQTSISELISYAGSAATNIILMKDQSKWTLHDLQTQIVDRLAPKWDVNRLEQELHKIDVTVTDDPDTIMAKIEKILVKRCDSIPTRKAQAMQHSHFIRLIHSHEPMHTYIVNNARKDNDPTEALNLARSYLGEHGNTVNYLKRLVQKTLTDAGVEVPHNLSTDSVFPVKGTCTPEKSSTKVDQSTDSSSPAIPSSPVAKAVELQKEQKEMLTKMSDLITKMEKASGLSPATMMQHSSTMSSAPLNPNLDYRK